MTGLGLGLGLSLSQRRGLEMGFNLSSRRVLLLGDSRAANETTRTYFSTGGTTVTYENAGPLVFAKFASRQKFDFIDLRDNFGVGGEKSDETLARLATALATGDFGAVVYRTSTNDRGAAAYTFAQTKANLDAAVALVRARRRPILIHDEFPRGDTVNTSNRLTNPQLGYHYQVSQYVRDTLHNPAAGVFAVEGFKDLENRTSLNGDAINGLLHDGLHFNAAGAVKTYPSLLDVLEMLWSDRDILSDYATNNLLANAVASGTGGSKSAVWAGTLPDNWTGQAVAGASGATATGSAVTGPDGDIWQKVVLSGTPTTDLSEISIRQDISAGWTIGQSADLAVDMIIENPVNIASIGTRLIQQATVGGTTVMDARDLDRRDVSTLLPSALSIRGTSRIPAHVIQSGVTNLRANYLSVVTGAGSVAIGGTVYIRRPKLVVS